MTVHHSVLELIGDTPIVQAQRLDTGLCELYLKLECMNPGGSIKDRIGLSMIEAAEQRGEIKPGDTLVEGTAGNTGIGLALVAQQKGYKLVLVVPGQDEPRKDLQPQGHGRRGRADPLGRGQGPPEYYQDMAERIASETPGRVLHQPVRQSRQPGGARIRHRPGDPASRWTAQLDAIVFGCGSSGTMTGLSRYFAKHAPHVELILADPVGSILTEYINEGVLSTKSGSWMVEGIGEDFLPPISDFTRVKKAYAITDKESFLAGRELLTKEGILGGSSTGTLLAAALKYCKEQTTPKKVVVFVCDTGNKYLSKMYNDYWMLDNGFIERDQHGDLRDLILRPYAQRDTVVVGPTDLLTVAYQRMKLYDVSQLPVMDGEKIVGIVDESDVLLHVYGDEERFRDPVSTAMVSKLDVLDVTSPIEALLPVFDRGHVAIVMDGDEFLGLITRIDLLNYLRRRAQ